MKKQKSLGYIIFLVVALVVLVFIFVQGNKMQVSSPTKDEAMPEMIGGDQDNHGCLIGAGYLWCPSTQKCQRLWEEECPSDFKKTVHFLTSKDSNKIIYEEPGKPAITTNYVFDGKCKVGEEYCNNLNIENGTKAIVEGITLDDGVLITSLKF